MGMSYEDEIARGIEILEQCLSLQSEKDGVARPQLNAIDKSKTLDQFAKDVNMTAVWLSNLYKLIPLRMDLSVLGRKLEKDGKIQVEYGGDYSRIALDFLLKENGLDAEDIGITK